MGGTEMATDAASARNHDLEWLLRPIKLSEFFGSYWESKPLHLQRADALYYRDLMSERDLEWVITHSDARYPAIKLAQAGIYYPSKAYSKTERFGEETFQGIPDVQRIAAEYAKGATINLLAVHRSCEPLARLCARLEAQLDHPVQANAYITPGNTAGFSPHYDTHEVIVLQLAGRKRWRIDKPPITLPHRSQPFSPQRLQPGPPLLELELNAGDLLYLPRGHVHSTTTSATYSVHVTLGITVFTWVELIAEALQPCAESVELRRALPAGFASRADFRPILMQRLAELLRGLSGATDYGRVVDSFNRLVKAGHQHPSEPLRFDVNTVNADSQLQMLPADQYRLTHTAESTTLELHNKKYVLPPQIAPTLQVMRERGAFSLRDLPRDMSPEDQLSLVRYLSGIGVLRAMPAVHA